MTPLGFRPVSLCLALFVEIVGGGGTHPPIPPIMEGGNGVGVNGVGVE